MVAAIVHDGDPAARIAGAGGSDTDDQGGGLENTQANGAQHGGPFELRSRTRESVLRGNHRRASAITMPAFSTHAFSGGALGITRGSSEERLTWGGVARALLTRHAAETARSSTEGRVRPHPFQQRRVVAAARIAQVSHQDPAHSEAGLELRAQHAIADAALEHLVLV